MITLTDSLAGNTSVKPCPFCGSRDRLSIMSREFFNKLVDDDGRAKIDIECTRCKLEMSDYDHGGIDNDYDFRRKRLISKWNNRHDGKEVSG